ncbi:MULTISPECIES: hypothetical protein [Paracoccaceae]|uniref:hypothetical protein n=1 Tax=Rhodobacterales TaxID=204455 RepID=UPI001B1E972D|nr:hypothetical protein [Roseicyclus sp.]MBO6625151.1 hypothetical protein [Roseicyclus sp.]MBO6924033.1 hypothetical protein [Roseicyclus sp.]
MTLQNRVLPTGEIVADPARGLFTGNRGIIHRPDGTLGTARWSHKHWLVCTLTHPRGIYHGPMPDRGWSALFFLDEAVALTAGHRPCHYCRREAYLRWTAAWQRATGAPPERMAMDGALHKARVTRNRAQIRHEAESADLPDFAFILWKDRAHLVRGDHMHPYDPKGYGHPVPRPGGPVTVLTPAPTRAVLAAGYMPVLHPSLTA